MTPESRDEGRGLRDQIERYRTAFISIVVMILIAILVGGYILAHERLALPGWVPFVGNEYFTLKGEFQTAQAVAPGQGQSVTIAGAKIGEISRVDLKNGEALVTMNITPKYARIYRDATMLLRPKTQLKDMAVEVDPGTPASGRVHSGATIPASQTAPDVNVDEFLAALDADTRGYLQELLAGAGEGLKGNGRNLSAVFKRLDPLAREVGKIGEAVAVRHANVARAIHNFRLLMQALGSKDKDLAALIDSSNAVFQAFAKEDRNVQATLRELPEALKQTDKGLGKLATAARVLGPTLHELQPFAKALAPGQRQTRAFFEQTTPVFKNQIRPFARQIRPVIDQVGAATQDLGTTFPNLKTSFEVLNEFFNELAYNPGSSQAGFLFFLDWANHNFNSAFSSTDANGPLGHGLLFIACPQLFLLPASEQVNPSLKAVISLLHPVVQCPAGAKAAARDQSQLASQIFGQGLAKFSQPVSELGGNH